jgi:hypothetical protein
MSQSTSRSVVRPDAQLLDRIAFTLDVVDIAHRVHLPGTAEENPEDWRDLTALVERFQTLGRPKAIVRMAALSRHDEEGVEIDGRYYFASATLARQLSGQHRLWLYCATCGQEIAALAKGLDVFQQLWFEELKMSLLLAASRAALAYIRRAYGVPQLASMAPGSGDACVWPIDDLEPLFAALGDAAKSALGVELTESMLMLPNKTVAGVYFAADESFVSCELCHRDGCPKRRQPFNQALWTQNFPEA